LVEWLIGRVVESSKREKERKKPIAQSTIQPINDSTLTRQSDKQAIQSNFTMKYTCQEYREEMTLAGLRRRLNDETLSKEDKEALRREIERLEAETGID
jgi:hypothetical protein